MSFIFETIGCLIISANNKTKTDLDVAERVVCVASNHRVSDAKWP